MKRMKDLFIHVAIALGCCALLGSAYACTSMIIGKKASADGSIMVTHNCDGDMYDARLRIIPAAKYEKGAMAPVHQDMCYDKTMGKQIKKIGEIPQVAETYSYYQIAYPFMNEHGIIIGENTWVGREECVCPSGMMFIEQLEAFGLQRAKTARECIKIMGELAEKYGYADEGENLTVVDANEAWSFDICGPGPLWAANSGKPGAVWAAKKIPDEHVFVSANRSRTTTIDLKNPEHCMASSNVKSFAQEMGWYDGKEEFLYWKAYNDPKPGPEPYNPRRREWRVFDFFAPSLKLDPYLNPYEKQHPFTVKPEKKVTIQDVMLINRDHYEGTQFDLTKGPAAGPFACPNRYHTPMSVKPEKAKNLGWERAISVYRCSYTIIGQARSGMPAHLGSVVWFGEDAPHSTIYTPFYAGNFDTPKPFSSGSRDYYDKESAWWTFNFVSNFADLKYSYMIKDINALQKQLEGQFIAMQPGIEKSALELYRKNPKEGRQFLTDYSNNMAMMALAKMRELGDNLVYKYNDGYVNWEKVGYPTEWLEKVEYGESMRMK